MENGSLLKVESIAECSLWSILQYFRPALSDIWYWKQKIVDFFEWPLKTGFTVYVSSYLDVLPNKKKRNWTKYSLDMYVFYTSTFPWCIYGTKKVYAKHCEN